MTWATKGMEEVPGAADRQRVAPKCQGNLRIIMAVTASSHILATSTIQALRAGWASTTRVEELQVITILRPRKDKDSTAAGTRPLLAATIIQIIPTISKSLVSTRARRQRCHRTLADRHLPILLLKSTTTPEASADTAPRLAEPRAIRTITFRTLAQTSIHLRFR